MGKINLYVTDEFSDDLLPNCDELTEDEIESGFACSNETVFKEPRYNDPKYQERRPHKFRLNGSQPDHRWP